MKKLSLCIVFIISAVLISGCSEYDNRLYVKNIAVDKNKDIYSLILSYYDFSQQEESFETVKYTSNDINSLVPAAMSDKNYSFRLCEAVFISPEIFTSDFNQMFFLVNSMKISPSADIVFYTGEDTVLKNDISENVDSPLYNFSHQNGKVSGRLSMVNSEGRQVGALLLKEGYVTEILDEFTLSVIDMITGNADSASLSFHNDSLWASLNNIKSGFYLDGHTLNIVLDMVVKERKGIADSVNSRKLADMLLEKEIANAVYDIYDNIPVNRLYNLHWYCTQKGTECEKIKVDVNIRNVL